MRLRRPAWFEIDLDAAAENLRAVRRLVGGERKIFAVLSLQPHNVAPAVGRRVARVYLSQGEVVSVSTPAD